MGPEGPLPAIPDLTRRAFAGALVLGARQVLVSAAMLLGGIALARLLQPADFGYYAFAALAVSLSMVISEGGIGASLIRESEPPSTPDLRLAFTFQLAVSLTLAAAAWFAIPRLGVALSLSPDGTQVVALALVAPLIAALRTVPIVRLERQLQFGPIGAASVAEVITFNLVAVAMAGMGRGTISLGFGIVAGTLVGTGWLLVASPWRPRLYLSTKRLRHHLRFGLPYQGIALISVAKDSINPLMIGLIAGATQVGLVEWAQRFAAFALFALFAMQRLLLTWFARLQFEHDDLRTAVRTSLFAAYGLVAPLAMAILVFSEPIVQDVFGEQWAPGLPVFWWLWAANILVPAAAVGMAALNALGESRTTFVFAVVWMVATWALGVPLIAWLGFIGFGVANLLVQVTNLLLFRVVTRRVEFPWIRTAVVPWCMAVAAAAIGRTAYAIMPGPSLWRLLSALLIMLMAYAGFMLARRSVRTMVLDAARGIRV
ncbi:oligosaccharide flippase family protein [Fodinibacter luteus]